MCTHFFLAVVKSSFKYLVKVACMEAENPGLLSQVYILYM